MYSYMKRTWIGHHRPISIMPLLKPSAHIISLSVTSLGDRRLMRAIVCVYIIEKVAHALAQNATCEWFSSAPQSGLGVVSRLSSEI